MTILSAQFIIPQLPLVALTLLSPPASTPWSLDSSGPVNFVCFIAGCVSCVVGVGPSSSVWEGIESSSSVRVLL